MSTRVRVLALLFAVAALQSGCGGGKKLYPVEGKVTLDGQPLEGATVAFTSPDGTLATGVTSASGKFKLLAAGQEGVPAGTYKVTVSKKELVVLESAGTNDPTKMYTEYRKKTGAAGVGPPKGVPGPKSAIPDRYSRPGQLPDQVVPPSGEIAIELSGKN